MPSVTTTISPLGPTSPTLPFDQASYDASKLLLEDGPNASSQSHGNATPHQSSMSTTVRPSNGLGNNSSGWKPPHIVDGTPLEEKGERNPFSPHMLRNGRPRNTLKEAMGLAPGERRSVWGDQPPPTLEEQQAAAEAANAAAFAVLAKDRALEAQFGLSPSTGDHSLHAASGPLPDVQMNPHAAGTATTVEATNAAFDSIIQQAKQWGAAPAAVNDGAKALTTSMDMKHAKAEQVDIASRAFMDAAAARASATGNPEVAVGAVTVRGDQVTTQTREAAPSAPAITFAGTATGINAQPGIASARQPASAVPTR
ncbi:MAG TPA: hypothetical protein VFT64_02005 [Rickettsiales bacterium]|nr:hypothetical protein [Rickettsiales bacterium]